MWEQLRRKMDEQLGRGTRKSAKGGGILSKKMAGRRLRFRKEEMLSRVRGRKSRKGAGLSMRENPRAWMGIGGGLLGSVAGLATWFAMRSKNAGKSKMARSGQAPGRSHVQRSLHPAGRFRLQPKGRKFGRT